MTSGRSGAWVLVVDDHVLSRKLVEQLLATAGLPVRGAGTLAEAEQLLAASTPAAIVLDMHLPDGHGLELARRCRADPGTAGCAIVACTAGDPSTTERDCRAGGCDAYVTKPIDTYRFLSTVTELVGARSAA
jgi:two-component system, cell cycle response regulator DivK